MTTAPRYPWLILIAILGAVQGGHVRTLREPIREGLEEAADSRATYTTPLPQTEFIHSQAAAGPSSLVADDEVLPAVESEKESVAAAAARVAAAAAKVAAAAAQTHDAQSPKLLKRGSRTALAGKDSLEPPIATPLPFAQPLLSPPVHPDVIIREEEEFETDIGEEQSHAQVQSGARSFFQELLSVAVPPSLRSASFTAMSAWRDGPVSFLLRGGDAEVGHAGETKNARPGDTADTEQWIVPSLLSAIIWAVLVGLVAVFYYREKVHRPKFGRSHLNGIDAASFDEAQWRFGLFDCHEQPLICLFAVFCGPVRWADTMRMSEFLSFSGALMLFVGLVVLDTVAVGVASLALLALLVYYRQSMRRKFKIPHGDFMTTSLDCLAYCLCTCCAITQEARQLEAAFEASHPAVTPPRQ